MSTEADRYQWLSLDEIASPPPRSATVDVIRDSWWPIDSQGRVSLFLGRSPQCNQSKRIAERIGGVMPDYAGVMFVPLAFIPHRLD